MPNDGFKKGYEKLQQQFNEAPLQTVLVGSLAVTALSKLIDALSAAKGRRAYAKQIDYKVRGRR